MDCGQTWSMEISAVFQSHWQPLTQPNDRQFSAVKDAQATVEWSSMLLTHWGRVTHICVGNLILIGSDNGLSPDRRQAIIWTNAGILSIGPLRTNFSEIVIEILTYTFKNMCLNVSSAKWRPFCLGLNVLKEQELDTLCFPCVVHTPLKWN